MAIGDIWRLSYEGFNYYGAVVNLIHVKFLSVGATPAGADSYFRTNLWELVKTYQQSVFGWQKVHGRQLAVPAGVYDAAYAVNGSLAGEGLPHQCAMVATLRTGFVGRRKRGRLYLAGFGEAKQANGGWDAAMVAAIQTYFDDLVAGVGLGGSSTDYQWGVWSRVNGGEDPGPYNLAAGWTPVSSVVVRNTVYSQRRRVVGVGL